MLGMGFIPKIASTALTRTNSNHSGTDLALVRNEKHTENEDGESDEEEDENDKKISKAVCREVSNRENGKLRNWSNSCPLWRNFVTEISQKWSGHKRFPFCNFPFFRGQILCTAPYYTCSMCSKEPSGAFYGGPEKLLQPK